MYYIYAANENAACCRVVKRLRDFGAMLARSCHNEGSRWVVMTKRHADIGLIYIFTDGKLRKTPDFRVTCYFN